MTRLGSMSVVGQAVDWLSTVVFGHGVRERDAARLQRHGEDGPTVEKQLAFAAELRQRAQALHDA